MLFHFFTKAGEYTQEEFEVARKRFEETGKPKIYTYFKVIHDEKPEQSLYDFMEKLDKAFGHYYGSFEHIDTLKLRILLSIRLQEMDFIEIKTENGQCTVDGKSVLPLKNVSEFSNNKYLSELREKLKETEDEYYQMLPIYKKGGCDNAFYKSYSTIATQRQNLIDEIEKLEMLIFNVSLRMIDDETHGKITERQKEAYRLFELGDYEGCMSVLNSEDIDNDFLRARKKIKEQDLEICRRYIKEHKTAIDILEAMTGYIERFSEIEERYKKIVPIALEEKTELKVARKFVSFLQKQNKLKEAIELSEKLEKIYDTDPNSAKAIDKASILHAMANLFKDQNQYLKAEAYYLKTIKICEALVKNNPSRYNNDLAIAYNGAGIFFENQCEPEKAKSYYLDAIKIYEQLAADNPDKYNSNLSIFYNNVGGFYCHQNQYQKAEDYFLKAIALKEELASINPEKYNPDLASCYNNIAIIYNDRPEEAERYFLRSISIREELANDNPDRYNARLAGSYNNIGVFYKKHGQMNNAEAYYLKAIYIKKTLAEKNPDRYNASLAMSYHNLGNFYAKRKQNDKADSYCCMAISLREKLVENNPHKFNADLALSYYIYAVLKNSDEYYKKAYEYAKKSIYDSRSEKIIKLLKHRYE